MLSQEVELTANPITERRSSDAADKECSWWVTGVTYEPLRVALEIWCCLGVAAIAGLWVQESATTGRHQTWVLDTDQSYMWAMRGFFMTTSFPFITLCWGNIDWCVMRLLFSHFQFRVVVLMLVWICSLWILFHYEKGARGIDLLGFIALNILFIAPFPMFLFLDGLQKQSPWFRLTFSGLFLFFLVAYYINITLFSGDPIVVFKSSSISSKTPLVSFQGSLSIALSTILLLSATTVWSMVKMPNGAIHFPIRVSPHLDMADSFLRLHGTVLTTENCVLWPTTTAGNLSANLQASNRATAISGKQLAIIRTRKSFISDHPLDSQNSP